MVTLGGKPMGWPLATSPAYRMLDRFAIKAVLVRLISSAILCLSVRSVLNFTALSLRRNIRSGLDSVQKSLIRR